MERETLPTTSALIPASELVELAAEPEPLLVNPRRMAIMVVDMQNGYISKGGFDDLRGYNISRFSKIIEPINEITGMARVNGIKVIYIVTVHPPDLSDSGGPDSPVWHKDSALSLKREHPEWQDKFTLRGTWGAEIIEELKPQKGDIIFEKMRFSAFFQTNLDTILKTYHIKYLIFTGVSTNICVEASLRDAYYLGYFPILASDATESAGGNYLKDATIHNVKTCYGWVATIKNVIKAMKPPR